MYSLILLVSLSLYDVPDGTLLFVEGGNEIVMEHTESPYSHVAVIFNDNGKPYVYEAVKPKCRKISLEDYVAEIEAENLKKDKLMKLWIRKPKDLNWFYARRMKTYCEDQIGRKYGVQSYISGKPQRTIHCAEMTARAMIAGGMTVQGNPCTKSPQSIMYLCSPYYGKSRML